MRTTNLFTITCLFTLAALGNTWADETAAGFTADKVQSMEKWPSDLRELMIERRKASIEGDVDTIARLENFDGRVTSTRGSSCGCSVIAQL